MEQATSHLLDPLILGTSFYQNSVINKNLGSVTSIVHNLNIKHFIINILIPILILLLIAFVVKYLYNRKKSRKN
jgi:hypothetical protein